MSDELLALVRRLDKGGGNRRPQGTNRRQAPPRAPARAPKCPNCLKDGHTAAECKAARVESSKRLCFECGQPGHQARRCPKLAGRGVPAKSIDQDDGGDEVALCLECCSDGGGFTRVGKAKIPQPIGTTMGDVFEIAFNRFNALREDSGDMPTNEKKKERHRDCSREM